MDTISTEENQTFIERAIEIEAPFSFRYWSDDALQPDAPVPPRRTVSPYEFKEGKDGKTLLVCWSHGAERVRYFDIERMGALQSEAEDEEFVRPVAS